MPQLPNVRHERFARMYNKTGVAAQAYLKAGYQTSTRRSLDVCAHRLLRHAAVQRRLKELKQEMARRSDITVDSLLADIAEDRALAQRLDQPSAALSATKLAAQLCGLMVERKESGAPGEFAALQTPEEVLAYVTKELGAEAAAALTAALSKRAEQPLPEVIEATHDEASGIN